MRTLPRIALACLLTLTPLAPAVAAPAVDQAGAEALKPRIEETLGMTAQILKSRNCTMERQGELEVEPAGSYYAITTPALSFTCAGGMTRSVGMLAINAAPTDDPNLFKVAMALPTPMTDTDKQGSKVGTLSLGPQSMSGLWNMKDHSFESIAASYRDVRYTEEGTGRTMSLASLSLNTDKKNTPGDASDDTVDMAWDIKADGIATTDQAATDLTPTTLHIKAGLSGVPLQDLIASKTKEEGRATFARSNVGFKLDHILIDAPRYGIDGSGALSHSANGAPTGRINLSLRGVPELLTFLSGPEAPQINGQSMIPPAVIGILTMVKMAGKPATDAQGRQSLSYDLVLTPDNKMTLNGTDLSALTGMIPAGKQQKEAKK